MSISLLNPSFFMTRSLSNPRYRGLRGFTLVEFLAVMVIVALLVGLSMMVFSSIGPSKSTQGAAATMASLMQQARTEAMTYGLGAALVIDNQPGSAERFRRAAVVRIEPARTAGGVPEWRLTARATVLPEGIYFLPDDLPEKPGGVVFSRGTKDVLRDPGQPVSSVATIPAVFDFPGSPGTPCLVYEFDGTGRLIPAPAAAAAVDPLVTVVVGAAIAARDGSLSFPQSRLETRRGFILRRNGRPAYFESPQQIDTFAQ